MRIFSWHTTDIRESFINNIYIIEKMEKITTKERTICRYSTLFYDGHIKIKEIMLPMITNHCLDNIKTESELRKMILI